MCAYKLNKGKNFSYQVFLITLGLSVFLMYCLCRNVCYLVCLLMLFVLVGRHAIYTQANIYFLFVSYSKKCLVQYLHDQFDSHFANFTCYIYFSTAYLVLGKTSWVIGTAQLILLHITNLCIYNVAITNVSFLYYDFCPTRVCNHPTVLLLRHFSDI